jgi:ribosomal protein L15
LRRVVIALAITAVGLVLLLGYKTSTPKAATSPPAAVSSSGTSGSSGSGSTGAGGAGGAGSAGGAGGTGGAGGSGATRTAVGDVSETRWGPVQIKVTETGGKITDVQAVQYPQGNEHDLEINSQALPMLRSEALKAQSARIDMVSGATVTSEGYLTSLQSALDKLHGA